MPSVRGLKPRLVCGGITIDMSYPLDGAVAWSQPREGSAKVEGASGTRDAWIVGTDHHLKGQVRWVPGETAGAVIGWDGASGWRALLEAARSMNAITFSPDQLTPATAYTMYLVEPWDSEPELEPNLTRAFELHLVGTVAIVGY